MYISDEYRELFNKLYNSSKRPLYYIESPPISTLTVYGKISITKYGVIIDEEGEVYAIASVKRPSVYYDAITGVLLYMESQGINFLVVGFKDLFKNYQAVAGSSTSMSILKLIDTNIDFERPVFGAVSSETRSPTSTTNEGTSTVEDYTWYYILAVIIAVSAIIVYILYRKKVI
ncbi:MAG: hypothetical protein B6U89_00520 [Desulfurococcales archaeon ex4484_58]|nr:MAG: hypothetical protein B6U89_00520 [Desulfurococcales archaeon ex4484_58]